MSDQHKNIIHIARYGIPADQQFLLNSFKKTYDQVAVNANILAHQSTAVTGFITCKAKKPFFIDPQTHAFQHNLDYIVSDSKKSKGQIKSSVKKLIAQYGPLVKNAVLGNSRPLQPSDFDNANSRNAFVKNVLAFQKVGIEAEVKKTDADKYYDFMKEKKKLDIKDSCRPARLIPPYFYLDKPFNEWLEVNIRCIADALTIESGIPIAAEIVISKDVLLSDKKTAQIISKYSQFKGRLDSILIWVDNFDETAANEDTLLCFAAFLKNLSSIAPTINLYGSYFSVALSKHHLVPDFIGVSHGLEYGEMRAVVPVGGGLPIAKFYLPSIHFRLPARYAIRAVRELKGLKDRKSFFNRICDCEECQDIIKNPETDFDLYLKSRELVYEINGKPQAREFPLPETKKHLINHYMWCKQREYSEATTIDGVIENLEQASQVLRRVIPDHIGHCARWVNVFNELK